MLNDDDDGSGATTGDCVVELGFDSDDDRGDDDSGTVTLLLVAMLIAMRGDDERGDDERGDGTPPLVDSRSADAACVEIVCESIDD
jgi:hypothetical protein